MTIAHLVAQAVRVAHERDGHGLLRLR